MCRVKYYREDLKCQSNMISRADRTELHKVYLETGLHLDPGPHLDCCGTSVRKIWFEEHDIYSYDGHAAGFKGHLLAICDECGGKWIEIPEDHELIYEKYGKDYNWYEGKYDGKE